MTEDRSNPEGRPSFAPPSERGEGRSWEPESAPDAASSLGDRSTFALQMARTWIKQHQEATMLGAFAVGVVVGALFRD